MIPRLREAWIGGAERLAGAGVSSARLDARVLLAHAMNVMPENIFSAPEPSPKQLQFYDAALVRRLAFEPIAYITGQKEFWGLSFSVGPGVLIPRPETETLLEEARRNFPDAQSELEVIDLGTGSGCLLISFLHDHPHACGTGLDRSARALEWAEANANKLGVSKRASFVEGDWAASDGQFNVIFANPPYVAVTEMKALPPEILRYEPSEALAAGQDGLEAYRALAPAIAKSLAPEGRAFIELGAGQAQNVVSIVKEEGLEILKLTHDLAGIPRCAVVARKGRF